jgi:hypothetical protein
MKGYFVSNIMAHDRIERKSSIIKEEEWALARQKLAPSGVYSPNGTKLRRKDSGLEHSFIVIGGKILAMSGHGVYLGQGAQGRVKLAEDEIGGIYALKIVSNESRNILNESDIAFDLDVALKESYRPLGTAPTFQSTIKHYLAYKYLGIPLGTYLENNSLSDDQRYELCIKIAFSFYALHSGKNSKKNLNYAHLDVISTNITIDNSGAVHLIDFGNSKVIVDRESCGFFNRKDDEKYVEFIDNITRERSDVCRFMRLIGPDSQKILNKEMLEANKSLDNLYYAEHSDDSYTALELCKKLTFIRFKLDYSTLYNQILTKSETETLIKGLNEHSQEIQEVYKAIDDLKIIAPLHLQHTSIMDKIDRLEEVYKSALEAYAQGNEVAVGAFSQELSSINQFLCNKHELTTEQITMIKLIMKRLNENVLFFQDYTQIECQHTHK